MTDTLDTPFIKELVALVRAQDIYGTWTGEDDRALLEPYILDPDRMSGIVMCGPPDPDVISRMEMFYAAVGISIERRTKIITSPMLKINREGIGRLVLTAGRLVALSKSLRGVRRFGFKDLKSLAKKGEELIAEGMATIGRFPDVAKA